MTAQTNSHMTRNLMQSARQGLLPVRGGGWLAGFGNMLNKELGEWFRTRRWLWQALIWIAILDGMVALVLFVIPLLEPICLGSMPRSSNLSQAFSLVLKACIFISLLL